MFDNVLARFALRAFLFGVAGANAVLIAALPGLDLDDATKAFLIGLGSALAYAGIGASVPQVEPSVGKKLEGQS
jgi:hypothetical protein